MLIHEERQIEAEWKLDFGTGWCQFNRSIENIGATSYTNILLNFAEVTSSSRQHRTTKKNGISQYLYCLPIRSWEQKAKIEGTRNALIEVSRLLWRLIWSSPVKPDRFRVWIRLRPSHSCCNSVNCSRPFITCPIIISSDPDKICSISKHLKSAEKPTSLSFSITKTNEWKLQALFQTSNSLLISKTLEVNNPLESLPQAYKDSYPYLVRAQL